MSHPLSGLHQRLALGSVDKQKIGCGILLGVGGEARTSRTDDATLSEGSFDIHF